MQLYLIKPNVKLKDFVYDYFGKRQTIHLLYICVFIFFVGLCFQIIYFINNGNWGFDVLIVFGGFSFFGFSLTLLNPFLHYSRAHCKKVHFNGSIYLEQRNGSSFEVKGGDIKSVFLIEGRDFVFNLKFKSFSIINATDEEIFLVANWLSCKEIYIYKTNSLIEDLMIKIIK